MVAKVVNIVIDQGFDFSKTYELPDNTTGAPLNITGYGVTASLKKSYASSTSVSFFSTIVDAENGIIEITLPKEESVGLRPGRYVYDIAMQQGGLDSAFDRLKKIEGMVLVNPGVTT